MESLSGSRTDAENGNQFGMTPLCVLFKRGFLNIEWWHTDTSFNASCSCDGSGSLCNHRQVTVYLTVASAKKHLTLLVPARFAIANIRFASSTGELNIITVAEGILHDSGLCRFHRVREYDL